MERPALALVSTVTLTMLLVRSAGTLSGLALRNYHAGNLIILGVCMNDSSLVRYHTHSEDKHDILQAKFYFQLCLR